ncbi:CotH kinase family protein, partial [Acinetobacter baumannii]|nr:spore coat protein CotH [Acinetobacter baumannii]
YASNWNWDANNIIPIVKPIILNDVIKRYAELRNKGIFNLNTVYRIERDIESKFSLNLFKQEQQRWPDIPSKDLGGICQIMAWLKERIKYLDAKYGYLDQGVLAQKLWNPPTLAAGASQSTTLNLSTATLGTQYLVDFQFDLKGTQMTAECKSAGVVTVTHVNNSGEQVNLDEGALRLIV